MPIDEYVDKVVSGDLTDPTLTFQLSNGFEVESRTAETRPTTAGLP